MHQDWLCLKGISDLLLVNKIMRCMKLALTKMHFTENLKLFVSRPCPACGFWQQCYFRPATLCSPPKHTSNLPFIFSVQWAPVSRILAFLFNKKKIPNYLLFLAASLYTETWNYNTKVSRPTWSLFGVGWVGIRHEMVQIFCAYWPHFSDNSSTLYFNWLPLFYCVVFIKCLERQEIS